MHFLYEITRQEIVVPCCQYLHFFLLNMSMWGSGQWNM